MRNKLKELIIHKVEKKDALELIGELLEKEVRAFKKDPTHAMKHAQEFAKNGHLMDAFLKGLGTKGDAAHLIEHAMIRTARDIANRGLDKKIPKIAEKIYECLELHKGGTHLDRIPLKFV